MSLRQSLNDEGFVGPWPDEPNLMALHGWRGRDFAGFAVYVELDSLNVFANAVDEAAQRDAAAVVEDVNNLLSSLAVAAPAPGGSLHARPVVPPLPDWYTAADMDALVNSRGEDEPNTRLRACLAFLKDGMSESNIRWLCDSNLAWFESRRYFSHYRILRAALDDKYPEVAK